MAANLRSFLTVALLAVGFVATTPVEALAYVDPGTGSYLFQLAAAGLLAGAFTVRRYWEMIKMAFRRESAGASPSDKHSSQE
jgi:hypothetical protein